MINLIEQLRIEAINTRKELNIVSGDILEIITSQYKNNKRKQITKGICISVSKKIGYSTMKVRNILGGEAVEQTFLLESPIVQHITKLGSIKKNGRAKKYYLRNLAPSMSKT